MSDQEIIAMLVKQRERCRKLLQLYQKLSSTAMISGRGISVDNEDLQTANRVLNEVLMHIKFIPAKPMDTLVSHAEREHAQRLLEETGDLLERVMIMEREIREMVAVHPATPVGAARQQAMRMYASGY